jgi:large subunit ribosomal protein L46
MGQRSVQLLTGSCSLAYTKYSQVYFFKGHVLAGQCKPDGKEIVDFAWLSKEEIKEYVEPHYWEAVKDMLSDV